MYTHICYYNFDLASVPFVVIYTCFSFIFIISLFYPFQFSCYEFCSILSLRKAFFGLIKETENKLHMYFEHTLIYEGNLLMEEAGRFLV